jgi:histidine triad (HIT) family protein
MEDCIFCKIIRGEIPSARVLETETVLAFLDINPVSKGHTLVIPKAHYATFPEMPTEVIAALGQALQ